MRCNFGLVFTKPSGFVGEKIKSTDSDRTTPELTAIQIIMCVKNGTTLSGNVIIMRP